MAANLSFFDILQINSNLNYANGRISISNFSTPELANYTKRTAASPLLSHLSLSHPLSFEFFFRYQSIPTCLTQCAEDDWPASVLLAAPNGGDRQLVLSVRF
jgi:hypothetical protein